MRSGTVVIYFAELGGRLSVHQKTILAADAKDIATLLGYGVAHDYRPDAAPTGRLYFVPDDTLLAPEARALGIRNDQDFFGGIVSHPFVKTKSIAHKLVSKNAMRPKGWSARFPERVHDVVLPGYTAFSKPEARAAAERLLSRGSVRLKPVLAAEGKGQVTINDIAHFDAAVEEADSDEISRFGLVLETNLRDVITRSVGQISMAGSTLSYHGVQRTVEDNDGRSTYGGSDLVFKRGGWDALAGVSADSRISLAIAQSRLFDAAMEEYPPFLASRRNYDVGQGVDSQGQLRSAVFESSWRIGGATPAELAALASFRDDPDVELVEASHVEEFGPNPDVPPGAIVQFRGEDPIAGPLVRYTIVSRTERRAAGASS